MTRTQMYKGYGITSHNPSRGGMYVRHCTISKNNLMVHIVRTMQEAKDWINMRCKK